MDTSYAENVGMKTEQTTDANRKGASIAKRRATQQTTGTAHRT